MSNAKSVSANRPRALGAALTRAVFLMLVATLSGCYTLNISLPSHITGTVYDAKTMKPLEGAYVLALYQKVRGAMGIGSKKYCEMSRGMFTGPDGKFALPINSDGAEIPTSVAAIKPDYFYQTSNYNSSVDLDINPRGYFSNRHVYLMPQDKAKPSDRLTGDGTYCDEANTVKDAMPSAIFEALRLEERRKYGTAQQVDAAEYFVDQLESRMGTKVVLPVTKDGKGLKK